MSEPVYLFDLDGCLANGDHRLHHIQKTPKDWTSYFAACGNDEPIHHMIKLLTDVWSDTDFFILTGRSDEVRAETMAWLRKHLHWPELPEDGVFMRKAGDHRPDDVIKMEMLAMVRAMGYEPIMAFEDRDRCVAAYRAAGIPCLQVAPGAF